MAITSLDQLIAGMLPPLEFMKICGTHEGGGFLHSTFYESGQPGAAALPSPGVNGAALTSYAGQIPFSNPPAGLNTYLARLECTGSLAGRIWLVDRLWHNSGLVVTTTGPQAITTPTWPARDRNGTTNGDGVQVAIEVSTITGNGGVVTNTTLSYTNSAGTPGRTATISVFPPTAQPGTFLIFQLQAGDVGIRSIQSISLGTSYVSGAIHLVAFRGITPVGVPLANASFAADAVSAGMPRLYDNSVPFLLWMPTATTAVRLQGQIVFSQG